MTEMESLPWSISAQNLISSIFFLRLKLLSCGTKPSVLINQFLFFFFSKLTQKANNP